MLVYIWQPQLITCFIPNTGAGSVGPVTVEVDGLNGPSSSVKRKSNVVNLTEWKGQFTYTHKDTGTLTGTILINAHLRADIHPFREGPHLAPVYYSVIFPAADDSYGTATASGTASYTDDSDPPMTTTWDWSGSHPLKAIWENDPSAFLLTGYVAGALHRLQLRLLAFQSEGLTETTTTSPGGGSSESGLSFHTRTEIYDFFPNYFYINMNNVWDILGNERNANICCSHNPLNNSGIEDIRLKISWPTIPASWAPDPTAAQ
jgi:hypothetical protein